MSMSYDIPKYEIRSGRFVLDGETWVKERTCKPVEVDGVMKCPECDYPLGIFSVPPFCGGCGAKVVTE